MKRFFNVGKKASSPSSPRTNAEPSARRSVLAQPVHTLNAKYALPPIPQPRPHEYIAIIAANHGLFIRPYIQHHRQPSSAQSVLKIPWRKTPTIEEVAIETLNISESDWDQALVVCGIVGVLELFSATHLLVITAKTNLGHILSPDHTVYGVKSVASIPLISYEQARTAINTLRSRSKLLDRHSFIASTTADTLDVADTSASVIESDEDTAGERVQFVDDTDIKMTSRRGTDQADDNASDLSSDSTSSSPADSVAPSPAASTTNVAQTIANRLSFWHKRSNSSALPIPTPDHSNNSSEQALRTILQQTLDKAPPSPEERQSELDSKILKECIREFSKGEMFFAYSFDVTRSLQHKYQQLNKTESTDGLSKSTNVLPSQQNSNPQHKSSPNGILPLSQLESASHEPSENPKLDYDGEQAATSPEPMHPLAEPSCTLPLWRRVDRQFWWNEWLSRLFIDAGLHAYILPIMQGYIETAHFSIPTQEPPPATVLHPQNVDESASAAGTVVLSVDQTAIGGENQIHQEVAPVQYIVVSRRSKDRAGLRYQRRGIDDEARVANFVETEGIVKIERDGIPNLFSFTQIRGSIPLYWTQTGSGLKPPPHLSTDRTREQNLAVLRRHFERTIAIYGPHTIVNLAEQQGKEGALSKAYATYTEALNLKDARYNGYDFHVETKGMKYENISKLVDQMGRTFESQGFFWVSGRDVLSEQHGTFRVNCIDCLDRTNVVQSAFARHALNRQLGAVALLNPSWEGKTEMDVVFNNLWANNGDAISRAYAGTSALKGDFTRTGKRDFGGLLSDGVNSLARMYTSTFSDWFSQAVLDFIVGNRSLAVFSEFLLKLSSSDPQDLIRLSNIRAEAIATSVSRVLGEGERLLSGWTLFAPSSMNAKIADKFEEKVLLLTVEALYVVSYDYTLQKVKAYSRAPLGDITGIVKGPYILSTLEEASRNPKYNAGFTVTWRNHNQETRVSSYSLRNSSAPSPPPTSASFPPNSVAADMVPPIPLSSRRNTLSTVLDDAAASALGETSFAAFKVLPIDLTRVRRASSSSDYMEPANDLSSATTCEEAVKLIVDSIRIACQEVGNIDPDFVKDEAVVSLAEAQRMTSVYAKMEHGVKKLLWLGG